MILFNEPITFKVEQTDSIESTSKTHQDINESNTILTSTKDIDVINRLRISGNYYDLTVDVINRLRISGNYYDLTVDDRLILVNLMSDWSTTELTKLNHIKDRYWLNI